MRRISLMLLSLLVCIACADRTKTQRDQSDQESQVAAETAYQGIAAGYKAGRISDETMAQVNICYERWRIAHQRYVDASNAGVIDLAPQNAQVQAALLALLKMESSVAVRDLYTRP